ncbi:uncharacterized protein B0I36DRAFT_258143 [Microdochium trichocladiopsis]|uniref:FAD-binding domain-containing protein n=1 Tax=Microdochium trichocladiopsis TaxID=1682393 RepID=A0A9P8XPH5_9PEZI|nr:uncharacterized protein B0I36DRAFT_258143 [Microdochium trichocladiopsis]KAH7009134.1 hypothetical protein B0I36DRAFT_258143 [Microdochium trichocladiopsis]
MDSQQTRPFRIVIAGAGLVGLTAAHILHHAHIDFVILEKRGDPAPKVGSVMTIWPQTSRIFQQLRLSEVLDPLMESLRTSMVISGDDSHTIDVSDFPSVLEKHHGWGLRILLRTQLVEALYTMLPEEAKSKVLLGKQVDSVYMDEFGVQVTCQDGHTEKGAILIGADGVRSRTRLCMEALRQHKSPHDLDERYQSPYRSTYRVLVSQVEPLPDAPSHIKCDGVNYGAATQYLHGKKVSCFAIYEKLAKPSSKHHRYTDDDKREMLKRWSHLMVMPNYPVQDLKLTGGNIGLYDCEEGFISDWYHGRIVLVGDAVRKLDPRTGMGYNEGVIDLVVLINGIRGTSGVLSPRKVGPTIASLGKTFQDYEKTRTKHVSTVMGISKTFARASAWLSWKDMVMARYLQPYLRLTDLCVAFILDPMIRASPLLNGTREIGQIGD